jgi:elongation factor G
LGKILAAAAPGTIGIDAMGNRLHTHWVIEAAVQAQFAADGERLAHSLARLASEDPTFGYTHDGASTSAVAMGTDESNLDAHLTALRRMHDGELRTGAPQVRYREALVRAVDVDYTHKKLTGTSGEFARVKLRIEPGDPGAGSVFRSEITAGVLPDEYIGGVEQGVRRVCDTGVLVGFPIDAIVSLRDGAFHTIDSSWTAFEIAGHSAMEKGASQAGVKLLEPIMSIEAEMPADLSDAVIADMNERRIGVIEMGGRRINLSTIVTTRDILIVYTEARLARLLGYAKALRTLSGGRASCAMSFTRYDEVQRNDGPDDFAPDVGMRA